MKNKNDKKRPNGMEWDVDSIANLCELCESALDLIKFLVSVFFPLT